MADGLKARVEKLRTRSERELEKLQGTNTAPAKPAAPRKKPTEAKGVGRDHSNTNADRLIAQLRKRIEATTDAAKRADLKRRIKALQETRVE